MIDGQALAARYARTEAGRAEIQRRAQPLSRAGRNLLLTIDASRSAEDWLVLVQGATEDDLLALIQAGLVAVQGAPQAVVQPPVQTPVPPSPPAAPQGVLPRMSLAQALQTKSQEVLMRRIVAEARPQLGRVRGYMLVVEAEYCVNAEDVRALAQKFVEQVRERDGDRAAIALAQVLIAPE
ncbi:hypothetical protein [Pseudaquabacterium pictum]|uniref:Uncharacterized protein n=1 Tax=Pseudaquabacterium pictum TaxID=2315236 RepID=A0A480AT54_9BURK|nr:hypothetical protein [Rubrivivax pictus]GCL64573.1 hypothetical protein AQPW35_36540 [Rubrivivax pictus]